MTLTFAQKSELDALVNYFGGESLLVPAWKKDATYRALVRKRLARWGKRLSGGTLFHFHATPKGIAVAKRFKVEWADRWIDKQPPHDPE